MTRWVRAFGAAGACALVAWVGGCSDKKPTGQVDCVVCLDGEPTTRVRLQFLPDPDKGNTGGPTGEGEADEKGRLRPIFVDRKTKAHLDGLPVGWYRVVAYDMLPSMAGEGREMPKSRWSEDYAQASTTPLSVELKPGMQEIRIDLKSRKAGK